MATSQGWACTVESRPALVSLPQPALQLTSGKRFRTKSLAGESKLKRRLSRAGRGWGSTAGGGPRVPDPSWMQEQSGFALQAALGTPGCTRGHGAGAAAGRAVCAPLPPLRAARTVPRLLPSSSQPRAVAGAQSWAGGSGGTGSLFVKAGPSKATRPAENEPAGRSARRARAYLAEPAGGRVSPARSARRERFPEEEGREGAPRLWCQALHRQQSEHLWVFCSSCASLENYSGNIKGETALDKYSRFELSSLHPLHSSAAAGWCC